MVPFTLDNDFGHPRRRADRRQTARSGRCIVSSSRYLESVTLNLPDQHLQGLNVTADRLRLATGIGLYTSGEVTLGQAALLAGVSQTHFLHELGRRGISVNYSLEDLEEDLKTIEILHPELRPR
jgi:predicted HTH domain antitoxin